MTGDLRKATALLLLAAARLCAQPASGHAPFTFRSSFWINLHQFLYVLGRARNNTPDSHRAAVAGASTDLQGFASLSAAQRATWDRGLSWYQKNVSPMDAVFDHDLVEMTNKLAAAGDAPSLAGTVIPTDLRTALEAAAPIYRQVWWERHARANHARIAEVESLLARYGQQISDTITRAYQQSWPPEGLTVQMCAYANWAGAYSTSGRLIVMSSTDPMLAGSEALETVFHEAMHQWDDVMIQRLNDAAKRAHVEIPGNLFHSLIFYTAGFATAQAVAGHHPYADALWARGLPGHAQLEQYWLPYLRGEGTLAEAIDRLVRGFQK